MILWIFIAILFMSAMLSLWSMRDLIKTKPKNKVLRREKRGMFGVIRLS